MENAFQQAIANRLDRLQLRALFNETEINKLKSFHRVTRKNLELDGVTYPAWRILHNNALGPGKGGIRFHPDVCEEEVKSLALLMSLKNSLLGLPYGGGKGGVECNTKELNPAQIQKISRAYAREFAGVLGQDIDIPAPDLYTNPQIMGWMLDEYEKTVGHHEPGMITGKPVALGGITMRGDAAARGAAIILESFYETMRMQPVGMTAAIQGFGNTGSYMAHFLSQMGIAVIAISDSKGGIYSEDGLDIDGIIKSKAQGTPLAEMHAGKVITNQELLETRADILVLAALENQITQENADRIKAKVIMELANGPISAEADSALFERGIHVIPDLLANAGGVTVSYFEWAQNRTGNILDEAYLQEKLEKMMSEAWKRVFAVYMEQEKKFDFRTAAYILAIRRILAAEQARA